MPSAQELLSKYSQKSYDEKLEIAGAAISVTLQYLRSKPEITAPDSVLMTIIAAALAIDKKYSRKEHKFFVEATGLSLDYGDFKKQVSTIDLEFATKATLALFQNAPNTVKGAFLSLYLCLLTSDKKNTPAEEAFIERFI